MADRTDSLSLSFDLRFEDLYRREGLVRVDEAFLGHLAATDTATAARLLAARDNPDALNGKELSDLIVALAPHVEDFIGELFGVSGEIVALQNRHHELAPLFSVKRRFVQKRAVGGVTPALASAIDGEAVALELERLFAAPLTEETFAARVSTWLDEEAAHKSALDLAARYAAWAALTAEGREKHRAGVLFRLPHKLDVNHLVPVETVRRDELVELRLPPERGRHREGFGLTDAGMSLTAALDQAHYCIKCHNQRKDSCRTGLKEKTGEFKKSAFQITLAGCPLEEKISEMNVMQAQGNTIAALAIATVDNPMVAGTGHRICNDCMKACIFQKQEPVDIPQVETRTLKDVLDLPWGFEIYSLLTRWNPLNFARPLPKPASGYKVLVVGLGPAGFTLAHHLMNDGHTVAGVDGLKIEPLPADLSGVDAFGNRVPFRPVRDIDEIRESLDDRVMAGFGGVAEYGITVRWDKNFLKVIRLLLERRSEFAMFGGVRFGGTITIDSAFALGFDHIALCAGAGRPTVIPMENGLARGVRQASDFLMALQLTGAAKHSSIANLQVRLPIAVIGGGLTAIDTATESLAYYPVQVEKFLSRYEALASELGEREVRAGWSAEDREVAEEFLAHGRAIRAERAAAAREGREPELAAAARWMGRRHHRLPPPADRFAQLHAEPRGSRARDAGRHSLRRVHHAGASGSGRPRPRRRAAWNQASFRRGHRQNYRRRANRCAFPRAPSWWRPARSPTPCCTARTRRNIFIDGRYFQAVDEDGQPVKPERLAKPSAVRVLMSLRADGRAISFFGDLHPSFAGNVVKAMGGAKQGYPVVTRTLARRAPAGPTPAALFDTAQRRAPRRGP